MVGANPQDQHPMKGFPQICFIKNTVSNPNIINGAIIAAKSVVVGNVAPYKIVGGNPAKCIRQRFDDETIATLIEIAWWNWEIDKINRNLERIVAADIEALINCE